MISVCIPVFNFNIVPLVHSLYQQAQSADSHIEIVCIDDCSASEYKSVNAEVGQEATFVYLASNIGRARIRNLFLEHTHGEYLLFLDDDCIIPPKFLQTYIDNISDKTAVVVGGRRYDNQPADREHYLRWLYGTRIESRTLPQRIANPYQSFMTNNFMIRRDILETIKFDDRISAYGHEDTLFGFRLKQSNIPILHIDNPVLNGDVESNDVFLNKSTEAVRNLAYIYKFLDQDPGFADTVRLLRAYRKVAKLHMSKVVRYAYRLTRRCLRQRFLRGWGFTTSMFSFYKLGLITEYMDGHQPIS